MSAREIKFRFWSKVSAGMSPPATLQDIVYNIGQLAKRSNALSEALAVTMQYTGLKDKNGKEIYEGDIMQIDEDVCEVEFEYGCFSVDNVMAMDGEDWYSDYEVIGNIYENSELLNK